MSNTSVTPGNANCGIGFSETPHRLPHPPSFINIRSWRVGAGLVRRRRYESTMYMQYSKYCEIAGGDLGRRLSGKGKVLETRHAGNIPSSAVPFLDPGSDDVAVALA